MEPRPCPKCNAACEPCGDLKVDDRIIPIYQCETCTIPWEVDGQVFPTAFTFGIRESGEWFDPAHYGDPKLN